MSKLVYLDPDPLFHFWQDCRGLQEDVDELEKMVESARQVTWKTFRQHVAVYDLEWLFPQYHWKKGKPKGGKYGLHIKDDWHVTFHRSKWKGRWVFYVQHSGIEYIFKERNPFK
jgi:Zn-finger nucleic acid-binding protein